MLNEATKLWRESHTRTLPSLKSLPRVEGLLDYAHFNLKTLVSTGIQVNVLDGEEVFWCIEGQEDDANDLMYKRSIFKESVLQAPRLQLNTALFESWFESSDSYVFIIFDIGLFYNLI